MVVQYLDFLAEELIPACFVLFDSLMIAPGVSLLGLFVAITLFCILIGSILMRVS